MKRTPAILLVDDDEDHLLVARRAIARAELPAEVRVAGDGDEALRQLGLQPDAGETAATIAVVLLDVGLPGLSGWDVLRRIRESERTRRIPVVMVSTSSRIEDVLRAYDLGANGYVVKRFDRAHPGGYLAEAAHFWTVLNEAPRGSGRREGAAPRRGPPGPERRRRRRRAEDASIPD